MDFLNNILSGDSALGKLANSYVTGLAGGAAKPKPLVVNVSAPTAAPAAQSFDMKKWLMIGGGAFVGLLALIMVLKKR